MTSLETLSVIRLEAAIRLKTRTEWPTHWEHSAAVCCHNLNELHKVFNRPSINILASCERLSDYKPSSTATSARLSRFSTIRKTLLPTVVTGIFSTSPLRNGAQHRRMVVDDCSDAADLLRLPRHRLHSWCEDSRSSCWQTSWWSTTLALGSSALG